MAVGSPNANALFATGHRTREIVTPEAVPLSVEVATVSERAGAFAIDFIFCNLAVFVIVTPIYFFSAAGLNRAVVVGLASLISFLIRNTYFMHFELMWRGTTPGKRIIGLRVIDRNGGPLLPSAVIARNLTREFEVFMPLVVLLSLGNAPGQWAQWLAGAWLLVIGAIPFLNLDRMRGGDLIAGTMVIALPRRPLLDDQAQNQFQYSFTHRELSAYGAYELQILEQVLRSAGTKGGASGDVLSEIGRRIRRKIGWQGEVPPQMEERFLRDFYTAERAFLERERLFGKNKADKHDHSAGSS